MTNWIIVGLFVLLGFLMPNEGIQAVWWTCCFFWLVIGQILSDKNK
jgi:hypothetical protein